MSKEHIGHKEIANFADGYVNLKRDDARKYREQVGRLRQKLEEKIKESPGFELRRMLLSGSLAKRTALKQISDIDVALYIFQEKPPTDMPKFLNNLVNILRNLYPNMAPEQITQQEYSMGISFKGTGLDVDIVPISYDGNPSWDGYLYSARTKTWLFTNINKHLDFIGRRKQKYPADYVQVVRLLKYWIKQTKNQDDNFRFKSFLVELILAHLADNGKIQLDNYVEAIAGFFNYIVTSQLNEKITFNDYYPDSGVVSENSPIQIFDPVNKENNAAKGYLDSEKEAIINASAQAADSIDSALYAINKGETIRYWQKVFGPSFGG